MTKKTPADDGYAQFARDVAATIRRWREVEGITQVQLAARMGVSRGRIAQFETAHVMPTLRRLYQLAQALNVTPATLVAGVDKRFSFDRAAEYFADDGTTLEQAAEATRERLAEL